MHYKYHFLILFEYSKNKIPTTFKNLQETRPRRQWSHDFEKFPRFLAIVQPEALAPGQFLHENHWRKRRYDDSMISGSWHLISRLSSSKWWQNTAPNSRKSNATSGKLGSCCEAVWVPGTLQRWAKVCAAQFKIPKWPKLAGLRTHAEVWIGEIGAACVKTWVSCNDFPMPGIGKRKGKPKSTPGARRFNCLRQSLFWGIH